MAANYTLRDATDADREFLLDVYAASRAAELSAVPWDETMKRAFAEHQFNAQTNHYREHYPQAEHRIIMTGGSLAGRLYVDRQDLISILDITVLEDFRGRGIGRAIIEAILAEGKASGRTVRIYTEDFNPAFGLFTALGFEVSEKDGFLCRLDAAP